MLAPLVKSWLKRPGFLSYVLVKFTNLKLKLLSIRFTTRLQCLYGKVDRESQFVKCTAGFVI